jgi:hypothetical protein
MADYKIPAGNSKGVLLAEASDDDLKYWLERKEKELEEGKVEEKFVKWTNGWIAEAKVVLAKRKSGGAKPAAAKPAATNSKPAASTSLAIAPSEQIAKAQGSYRDAAKVTKLLDFMAGQANLISPTTACPTLPEGCAVAFSVVHVDTREAKDGGEIYSTGGGGYAIVKSALLRISAAAGINFDDENCKRLDDRSNPRFCAYRAAGSYTGFDGLDYRLPPKTIELDLNDDSDEVAGMLARKKPDKDGTVDITDQLREMRMKIVRHAEGRAIAGVIRNLGMKTSYRKDELEKPFVVARLQFTGESDDPAIRGRFAEMIGAKMLGGKEALYRQSQNAAPLRADSGNRPVQAPELPHDAQGWKREVIDSPAETPALASGEPAANGTPKTEGAAQPSKDATAAGTTAATPAAGAAPSDSSAAQKKQRMPDAEPPAGREPGDDTGDLLT